MRTHTHAFTSHAYISQTNTKGVLTLFTVVCTMPKRACPPPLSPEGLPLHYYRPNQSTLPSYMMLWGAFPKQ